jgi:hypothetical protein
MQIIKWSLQAFFVSIEFLIITILLLVYSHWPEFLATYVGDMLKHDLGKCLCFLPAVFCGFVFKWLGDVLSPSHDNRKILWGWGEVMKLKIYALCGLVYVILSTIVSVISFIFLERVSLSVSSTSVFAAIIVSFISAMSIYLARYKIIELLDSVK